MVNDEKFTKCVFLLGYSISTILEIDSLMSEALNYYVPGFSDKIKYLQSEIQKLFYSEDTNAKNKI